jgi:hypothetical protein
MKIYYSKDNIGVKRSDGGISPEARSALLYNFYDLIYILITVLTITYQEWLHAYLYKEV